MGKRARLLKLLQDVRASYWFLPTVLVFCGLCLAGVMSWVDHNSASLPITLPATFIDTQADGARSILSVIAQSIIGVTGVTFSMTLVAVSFASGNYGPRLVGNFMRDRGNQLSLGILIATFVYAVVVLRTVQDSTDGGIVQYVPQYSIIVAMGLTLICVFTLIFFIHHVPETINVSKISATISAKLDQQLRDLIDDKNDTPDVTPWPKGAATHKLHAHSTGYIQTCKFDQMAKLASENDVFIRMLPFVGDFLTRATVVFEIWSEDDVPQFVLDDIAECYAIGASRTENQNPSFLAEQLVEMVARALSPGMNDPYTAIDCLNRLASALAVASIYNGGLTSTDVDRLEYPKLTYAEFFGRTFPLCRQYVLPDNVVRHHAISLLEHLQPVARQQDKAMLKAEIKALSD